MPKVEAATVGQANEIRMPENYTQVAGIYARQPETPQFLNAPDNVQYSSDEILREVTQAAAEPELRFFRMR